jgi:dTDP-4-amino-4,6-dideoxygalactose transaminase
MIPIARPLLGTGEEEAVLCVLAPGQLAQRKHIAAFERRFAELCAVQTPTSRLGHRHIYHQIAIRIPDDPRRERMMRLQWRGIGTAIHYLLGIHQQPFYKDQIDKYQCIWNLSFTQRVAKRELPYGKYNQDYAERERLNSSTMRRTH